ncbi:MAG TPA: DUF6702 family protein [Pyrinomonadaceae bacterium]
MKKSILVLTFSFLLAINVSASRAHTFHTSLTRMDYNAKEKLVEISIQLFTHDLVPALERFTKKNVDLEKTPDLDKMILRYLDINFVLKNRKGEPQKLVWVGKEQRVDTAYVYVQIPLDEDFGDYTLQNTIFFESFPKQANLVVARYSDKKTDLLYKIGDREKQISAKPQTEKTGE